MPKPTLNRKVNQIAGQCIASRWRAANRAITSIYDQALRPLGVKVSQFNILIATAKMGVARPRDLGTHLRLEASTLSRNLERMRASGWLETVADASDLRSQSIRLTRSGLQLIEEGYPLWERAQREAAAWLGANGAKLLAHVDARGNPPNAG